MMREDKLAANIRIPKVSIPVNPMIIVNLLRHQSNSPRVVIPQAKASENSYILEKGPWPVTAARTMIERVSNTKPKVVMVGRIPTSLR